MLVETQSSSNGLLMQATHAVLLSLRLTIRVLFGLVQTTDPACHLWALSQRNDQLVQCIVEASMVAIIY